MQLYRSKSFEFCLVSSGATIQLRLRFHAVSVSIPAWKKRVFREVTEPHSEMFLTLKFLVAALSLQLSSLHAAKQLFRRACVAATFPALAAACRAVLRLAVS